MRYLRFIIENYRAISGPLTIDLDKKSLLPIIGVNESGKTTILHAICAFDMFNDEQHDGRHLEDTGNLYQTPAPEAKISAELEVSRDEYREALIELAHEFPEESSAFRTLSRKTATLPTTLIVDRSIKNRSYDLRTPLLKKKSLNVLLATRLVKSSPYILYFDDFRDKLDDKILIDASKKDDPPGWLAVIEELFRQTDSNLSVFDLPDLEERRRNGVISRVQRHLNRTLTSEWQNFRLDDREALEISISLKTQAGPNDATQHYLSIAVVEKDSKGDEHFFFVSDRSKGFYWFFNFVMKLEFNPKKQVDNDRNTVYLLDEPGSYLHASAQSKLCNKLRSLSEKNRVIYCTHSHYLLDPEIIPFTRIHAADRDKSGSITLVPISDYSGSIEERRLAFQPVIDALQIKPFLMDLSHKCVILVEGMFDYYALELFRNDRPLLVMPSVGADSIKYFVSVMIAWQRDVRALWDADAEGRKCIKEAQSKFGEEFSVGRFHLLPCKEDSKRILQDLFDGADLSMIRNKLGIASNSSFERTIGALFYSPDKASIFAHISNRTKNNFAELFNSLKLPN